MRAGQRLNQSGLPMIDVPGSSDDNALKVGGHLDAKK
jgi:hypothetical protein